LEKIDNVKKIGRIWRRVLGPLDRAQQSVSSIGSGKNLGLANFSRRSASGIIWKKKNLQRPEISLSDEPSARHRSHRLRG